MNAYLNLIKSDWRLLLFGFAMMFCSSPGQTFFISLFGGEIRSDLGLSNGQFGSIYSAATLISAIVLLWSGPLLDRIDLRKFAVLVAAGLACACILMAFSQNMLMLLIAILGLRQLGQGLMSMSSSTTMMRYLSASKGKANSLAMMGYSVAEAVMPSVIVMLMLFLSWRQSWLVFAALLFVCVPLLVFFTLREYPQKHQQYLSSLKEIETAESSQAQVQNQPQKSTIQHKRQWTRAEVIRDPLLYLFVPALMSQSMIYTGFMFHQIHLITEKAWSLPQWASLFLLFSSLSIVTSLCVASIADKIGAVKLVPYVMLPSVLGLLVLSSSNHIAVAVIFMICMALSTGAQGALSAPFFADRYGNKHFGSIKSLGTFSMVFMSAFSPVLIGWLVDRGVSIDSLASGFAIYAVIVVCLALFAYRLSLRENNKG